MLNSFWGKFGENLHKPTTQSVYTAAGLFDIVSNELLDIRQIRICNVESLEIVYQIRKENEPDNGRVNIFGFHHLSRPTQTVRVPSPSSTSGTLL